MCGKGLGSKYLTYVDDYVQCVGRDWEVCDVWMIMYSVCVGRDWEVSI